MGHLEKSTQLGFVQGQVQRLIALLGKLNQYPFDEDPAFEKAKTERMASLSKLATLGDSNAAGFELVEPSLTNETLTYLVSRRWLDEYLATDHGKAISDICFHGEAFDTQTLMQRATAAAINGVSSKKNEAQNLNPSTNAVSAWTKGTQTGAYLAKSAEMQQKQQEAKADTTPQQKISIPKAFVDEVRNQLQYFQELTQKLEADAAELIDEDDYKDAGIKKSSSTSFWSSWFASSSQAEPAVDLSVFWNALLNGSIDELTQAPLPSKGLLNALRNEQGQSWLHVLALTTVDFDEKFKHMSTVLANRNEPLELGLSDKQGNNALHAVISLAEPTQRLQFLLDKETDDTKKAALLTSTNKTGITVLGSAVTRSDNPSILSNLLKLPFVTALLATRRDAEGTRIRDEALGHYFATNISGVLAYDRMQAEAKFIQALNNDDAESLHSIMTAYPNHPKIIESKFGNILHLAVSKGAERCLLVLLEQTNLSLDALNQVDKTPLQIAAIMRQLLPYQTALQVYLANSATQDPAKSVRAQQDLNLAKVIDYCEIRSSHTELRMNIKHPKNKSLLKALYKILPTKPFENKDLESLAAILSRHCRDHENTVISEDSDLEIVDDELNVLALSDSESLDTPDPDEVLELDDASVDTEPETEDHDLLTEHDHLLRRDMPAKAIQALDASEKDRSKQIKSNNKKWSSKVKYVTQSYLTTIFANDKPANKAGRKDATTSVPVQENYPGIDLSKKDTRKKMSITRVFSGKLSAEKIAPVTTKLAIPESDQTAVRLANTLDGLVMHHYTLSTAGYDAAKTSLHSTPLKNKNVSRAEQAHLQKSKKSSPVIALPESSRSAVLPLGAKEFSASMPNRSKRRR